jgi:hypothetical protein
MMQTLALKTIYTLNWLPCRAPKKAIRRMPLDGDSPCYYPPTNEEELQLSQLVELLNSQGDTSSAITQLPG